MSVIYSDDANAIEKLKEKLLSLETQRDQMKAINKDFRQAKGDPSKMKLIPEDQRQRLIDQVEKAYSWEKQPYPKWQVTNLGANIRTVKQRITKLEVVAEEETSEYELNGVRVLDNCEDSRLQLFFDGKPGQDIRTKLKQKGFRWSPSTGCWQSYRGKHQDHRAKQLLDELALSIA